MGGDKYVELNDQKSNNMEITVDSAKISVLCSSWPLLTPYGYATLNQCKILISKDL